MTISSSAFLRPASVLLASFLAGGAAFGAASNQNSGSDYVVLVSQTTKGNAEWMKVAEALVKKHDAKLVVFKGTVDAGLADLKKAAPRKLALVAPPEEIDRVTVNSLHRVTRKLDDDPYGDCIWGIVTGYGPDDAMRIVNEDQPLTITRGEGTTNFDWNRFSDSMAITDWAPFQIMEQKGYKEPQKESLPDNPEGMAFKFADYWEKTRPQYIVTSSHATQYNLEMPFSKGVIVSFDNKFHVLTTPQLRQFASFLRGVVFDGKEEDLKNFLDEITPPVMAADEGPRVWVAAGNCLFGDVKKTRNSMMVAALSAYGCRQAVGYTVTSWYGAGGWGTHGLFFDNHDASSLAEAWYLNNQFILSQTQKTYPKLMDIHFNASDLQQIQKEDPGFHGAMTAAGYGMGKDQLGLIYDRDTVAFYGDPAWIARLDEEHAQSPWHVSWNEEGIPAKGFEITANKAHKGKFAVWFPKRITPGKARLVIEGNERPISDAGLMTNDFLLIDELELPKGGKATVILE